MIAQLGHLMSFGLTVGALEFVVEEANIFFDRVDEL